jgi:hypothetical protein
MLVIPFVPTAEDAAARKYVQHLLKDEAGKAYENDIFSIFMIDSWANLISQFVQLRAADRYRILLRNSMVVAQSNTLESILADWALLNQHIMPALKVTSQVDWSRVETEDILLLLNQLKRNQDTPVKPIEVIRKQEYKDGKENYEPSSSLSKVINKDKEVRRISNESPAETMVSSDVKSERYTLDNRKY